MSAPRPRGILTSRRRFPRLQILGMVDGYLLPIDVRLKVIELSAGGFSVRSATPFPPGTKQHFRFTTGHDRQVSIDATAVHCRLVQAGPDKEVAYVSGFEFVSSAHSDEAVAVLIDTLSSVLSLE